MKFVFTKENLIDNINKLGPWSAYGLASEALRFYFPDEYNDDEDTSTAREAELLIEMGFKYWTDVIEKYHKDVGYSKLDPTYVNEY